MPSSTSRRLSGMRVLIVEDEYLIADDLDHHLRQHGATIVGPVGTIADARELACRNLIDCALVDLNLRGESTFDLLDHLLREGIPVLIVSGYDLSDIPSRFHETPFIQKPVTLSKDGVSLLIIRMLR